jgi:hypothetical protein
MIRTAVAWLIAALLLAALLPQPVAAQRPDLRVSPPDPVTHDIPAGAKIQSAATLGNHTLAVWGTTRTDGDTIASTLRMQMLDGSSLAVDQLQLSSDSARPGRFVQVVAFDTSFAVIWNDYRVNTPGLYLRFVGRDGKLVGNERRLTTTTAIPDSTGYVTILGEQSPGRLLMWYGSQSGSSGLYGVRIVEGDRIISAEQQLGKIRGAIRRYQKLPGWTLIYIQPTGWMAVDRSGQIDSRPLPQSHFTGPFYVSADTSLIRVTGDTVLFHASIFDAQPNHILKVAALDSATKNSVQLGRDSTGALLLYFTHVFITGDINTKGYIRVTVYRIRITEHDSISTPERVDEYSDLVGPIDQAGYFISGFLGASSSIGCDNSSLVTLSLQLTEYYFKLPPGGEILTIKFAVNSSGLFNKQGNGYQPSCVSTPPINIARPLDTTASTIRISLADSTIELRAETAPWQLAVDQVSPGIYRVDGKVMTTWQRTADRISFDLSEWDYHNDTPAILRDRVFRIPAVSPQNPTTVITTGGVATADWHYGYIRDDSDWIINNPNLSLINSQKQAHSFGTFWVSTSSKVEGICDWSRYVLRRADTNRWTIPISISNSPDFSHFDPNEGIWEQGLVQGYDPNNGSLLLEVKSFSSYRSDVSSSLQAFSSDGKVDWNTRLDLPSLYTAIIPADSLRFIRINGLQASLYEKETVIEQFAFTQSAITPRYQRLLGRHFLRRYWLDSTGIDLRLEIYSLNGSLEYATTIQHHSHNDDMMILQSPRDSSVVIVSGGEGGVHLTALDKQLHMLASNITISATHGLVQHPAATFRNDSLYVVWQDNRNGNADIYGNVMDWSSIVPLTVDIPTYPTRLHPDFSPDLTQQLVPQFIPHPPAIIPNPASTIAIIELDVDGATEIKAELFDLLGAAMAAQTINATERGRVALQFDLQGLPVGVYMVRYRTATTAGTMPLHIMR